MIVNDDVVVDKKSFLHKISSLRRHELAGQGLYPARTDVGEKTACQQRSRFCTSDPVHIQRLVHSRAASRRFQTAFCWQNRSQAVFRCWQSAFSGIQSCRQQLAPILSRSDSACQDRDHGCGFGQLPLVRQNGQSRQIRTRANGPDHFFSKLQQTRAHRLVFVVDAQRVFATSCQTFLQQRTRQRMQHPGLFFAFPLHLRTSSS